MTKAKGFTLVEVLISSLVFGLIMTIVMTFLSTANRAANRTQLESDLNTRTHSALARFSRDLMGASGVKPDSTAQKLILEIPCYDATGDLDEATTDQVIYELSPQGKLLYTRGGIIGQTILDKATNDTQIFRYFDSNRVEGLPQNAAMVRITLHTIEPIVPKAIHCRQSQDFRMRNAL